VSGEKTSTVRFRADMPFAYAQAVLLVTEYARGHSAEFEFGPLELGALKRTGLVVTGPDLEGVTELLAGTPGLVEVPA
jgi:hypothetical protein